ncbi:HAMP domain-containing sensor histidine kinase [Actinomadura chokoriensis]|uniref:sensor histidine kinase n=1 Tax=Actinomadura chokoriensis TaxID=454156 RepID=UPI0031F8EE7D
MTTERRDRARRRREVLFFSVRGRATLLTAAVSALILAVVFVLLMLLAQDWARNRVSQNTQRTAERVAFDIAMNANRGHLAVGPGDAAMVQVVSPQGKVVAATEAAEGHPPFAPAELKRRALLIDERTCPRSLDGCVWVFGLRLRSSPWGPGVMVMAAAPLPTLLTVWLLPLAIALVLTVLLALITWWTWHTVGRALVPVDRLRAELADVGAHGLDRRVAVPATAGETRRLAETVNATLTRLEEASERERRFVSDASHDLRNPIAGLQTRLEVALDEPDDHPWKPLVRAALGDVRRLNDIVVDLLELSRLDARTPRPVERVDLAELVRREVARRDDRIPVETRSVPGVVVTANRVRLGRVLGNLLNNAERHAESRITVTVDRDGGDAVLEVLDDGAGIPPESRERVFERFARLPESRARDPQGTGLGLPIAREIAEIYGGTLRVADSPRGARLVLRLPLVTDDPGSR